MLRFAICDDDINARTKYTNFLNTIFENNDIDAKVVFDSDNPNSFYKYISSNPTDVIFLDIDLKTTISGLELAKKIREINKSVYIVFITGHLEYVLMSFKVTTFDYLVKPISLKKLEECILRLNAHISSPSTNHIKFKSGTATHLLNKNQILYVEKNKSKSCIYTENGMIEISSTLEDIAKILPKDFKRSHKSYIVNTNKISSINSIKNEIHLEDSFKCYLGKKYKKDFLEGLNSE